MVSHLYMRWSGSGLPHLCVGNRLVQATDTITQAIGPALALRNGSFYELSVCL